MEKLAGTTIKGYRLEEQIGAGGFGVVYRARQTTIGREVAIKIILPRFANDPQFIRRFETEAQLIARLEHPHITPLHDYWRDPSGAYLVMRYLRGHSIRQALLSGPYELDALSLVLDQVASALDFAHRNEVIHRDIKPDNILLDEDGNAYLADFGIAKDLTASIAQQQTGADAVVGSLDYLSPEQARCEPVTPRTDIYSLGVTLYEMITGEHPFKECTAVQRLYKHISDPLPEIRDLPPDVRTTVNEILQCATAKDPAKRYADVLALAVAFRQGIGRDGTQQAAEVVEQLTLREQEILALIAKGRSNREIADHLFVTVATVKWHIAQLYKKLGVRSRVHAIVRARELNLIVTGDTQDDLDTVTHAETRVSLPEPENPYKGLRAFQTADARDFFGRDDLTQKLVERMRTNDDFQRFLAIVGPSGSGKSSLVRAGLIPALWKGALPGSEKWFVVDMIPGAYPLDKLETALIRVAANQAGSLREQLQRDARGLLRVADIILPADDTQLVIVVDQFEEVFTLVTNEQMRQHFLDLLRTAVTDQRSRVRVVITLRADYYDRPLHYPEFGEMLRSRMETILPLSAKGIERAVRGPAERVGVIFEQGLVEQIVSEMNYQAGALPLLQYALTELFDRRQGRLLTHAAYQQIGGAVGALANRADEVFGGLTANGQGLAQQLFLRLVTLGEGAEDTRRRVPQAELLSLTADTDLMEEIIDQFAAYRLLSLDHDPITRQPTVEVAHEAILREWSRLREWLNASREDIRQERALAHAAEEWAAHKRDRSYLLHGTRLEQFQAWAASTDLAITTVERAFLDASSAQQLQQQDEERERQARELALAQQAAAAARKAADRLRYLVSALTMFLVVAVVLGGLVFASERRTEAALTAAEHEAAVNHSLVLASGAVDAYENGDSVLAMQLALEALNLDDPPPEAENTFRDIAQGAGIRFVLHGHQQRISAVSVSPDGRFILSGSCADAAAACTTGELILWDVQEQAEIRRMQGHAGWVTSIVFSPDGQTVISASSDSTVILWALADGEVLHRFEGHTAGINSLAISPDGATFVSASDDMTLMQWNIETGEIVREFRGHTDAVDCVVFSEDGQMLLSGSADMTMIQWDAVTGERLMTFEGNEARVTGVAFAPNQRIVSVTRNGELYLWDAVTGERLREHKSVGNPPDLVLSPDGRTVFFGELGTMRVWSIDQWQYAYSLGSFQSGKPHLTSLASSVQGGFGVLGGEAGDLVVWDFPTTGEIRRFGDQHMPFISAIVSPDNRYLMLGTHDGEVIMQDRATGEEIRRFSGGPGWVWRIVFSPDGQQLLVVCADWYGDSGGGSFILWDVATGTQLRSFTGFNYIPTWAGFSPDGQLVIGSTMQWGNVWSESIHGDNIVWNTATGAEVLRLDTDQWVNVSLFTEDGRYIITGSGRPDINGIVVWDSTTGQAVRHFLPTLPVLGMDLVAGTTTLLAGTGSGEIFLLDYLTGEELRRFCCHNNWVRYLDLSADQRYIIAADQSAVVILWDFATGQEVRRFYGHEGYAWQAVFSPDGQTAYSAGYDGSVIEWQIADVPLADLIAGVRANRYIPDFTCDQRALYRIAPLCPPEASGSP